MDENDKQKCGTSLNKFFEFCSLECTFCELLSACFIRFETFVWDH